MFWKKTPLDRPARIQPVEHSEDRCLTCGGLVNDGVWTDSPHVLSECVYYQRRVIANQSTKIKNLESSGNFYSKTITELRDRIVILENTNRDITSTISRDLTRFGTKLDKIAGISKGLDVALLRIDSLADDISRLYKTTDTLKTHDSLRQQAKPKPRPKK